MKIRTGFSFRAAAGHLPEVMSRLVEIGSPIAPISDRCSTFGFVKWTKLAKEAGLRPVYGVELAVVPALDVKIHDYWTFFAKTNLRDLHDLIWLASSNKVPSLTYAQALAAPGLIKISGERTLLDHVDPQSKDFYVALAPSTPVGLYRNAKARGYKFFATSDNYYPRETDLEFYRIVVGREASTHTYPRHILSPQELRKACWFADDADFIGPMRSWPVASRRSNPQNY